MSKFILRTYLNATAVAIALGIGAAWAPTAVAAAELTAVEKLYAELGKLDPAERQKRLEEGARKEGGYSFINSLRGALGRGHIKIFQDRYPHLKIDMSELGSQDAFDRLVAESTAGRHLTDVVGGSIADMADVIKYDVAARYPTPASNLILPRYRSYFDEENRWTVWYWSEHGVTYNPTMLKAEDYPKSWKDLCKPVFKSQVSFDPMETRFLTGLLNILGRKDFEAWFDCMGKNDPIVMRGHTVRLNLMAAGDHAASADQYFYQGVLANRKNPAKFPFAAVYTAEVIANAGANAINDMTPHPYASALYVDWCVTEENQQYMKGQFRGPVSLSHPYMPDDVVVVPQKVSPQDDIEFVQAMWNKYFGVKR